MGLFPFIGSAPNTGFVPASLLTATGHIQTTPRFVTSHARVFAVGAVRADYGGNIVEAIREPLVLKTREATRLQSLPYVALYQEPGRHIS
jgi:thioredoxin reductase